VISLKRNGGTLLADPQEVDATKNGNPAALVNAAQAATAGELAHAPLIEARNLSKVYQTGAGGFTALNEINLQVLPGEFLRVVGKSGAGKTTLLNMLSGVSEITSGEVLFRAAGNGNGNGAGKVVSLGSLDEDEMAVWRGHNVGIVYQSFELLPQLDLVDNVMLPQDFSSRYRPAVSPQRALELLDLVELGEHVYKLPTHISGGQKQRVAIARALVNDPPLILADEPTGNLDTATAETIFQLFKRLIDAGKTIVMVTHDSSLAARCSRTIYIADGEIAGAPSNGNGTGLAFSVGRGQTRMNADSSVEPVSDSPEETVKEERVAMESRPTGTVVVGVGGAERVAYPPQAAITLRNVVKTFVNAAGSFTALKGINLQMNYGQFVSIVGKSGSGKSTLLNMLTGIDHPTSGEVIIGEQNIYKMSESKRALWRGRNMGIVFQFFQLLPTLTLLENTMLPMDYCNAFPVSERPQRALELLKMVGLGGQTYKLPTMVSSGQQQSAAIARALATDPPIIVADEPTGNLDSRSAVAIIRLFRDLAAQGKTVLIVTHDPSITRLTDQTVILSDGEIIDDVVARALPLLNHPQMLQITHQAAQRVYQPGETILQQGEQVGHFFMVASGEVDVVLKKPGGPEMGLARLGAGQFFGEVELLKLNRGKAIASVRAASSGPAEIALLDREEFLRLIGSAPAMQAELAGVAQARWQEHQARAEEGGR
jgi:ABC-type lipoprotein export system ATPase subunit